MPDKRQRLPGTTTGGLASRTGMNPEIEYLQEELATAVAMNEHLVAENDALRAGICPRCKSSMHCINHAFCDFRTGPGS